MDYRNTEKNLFSSQISMGHPLSSSTEYISSDTVQVPTHTFTPCSVNSLGQDTSLYGSKGRLNPSYNDGNGYIPRFLTKHSSQTSVSHNNDINDNPFLNDTDAIPTIAVPPQRLSHISLGGFITPRTSGIRDTPSMNKPTPIEDTSSNVLPRFKKGGLGPTMTSSEQQFFSPFSIPAASRRPSMTDISTNHIQKDASKQKLMSRGGGNLSQSNGIIIESIDPGADPECSLSLWNVPDTTEAPSTSCIKYSWDAHQRHPTQPPTELFRMKGLIDHCLKQDETSLLIDDIIAAVPIGNYIPVSKIFSLTGSNPQVTYLSSSSSSQENIVSQHDIINETKKSNIPKTLFDAYQHFQEKQQLQGRRRHTVSFLCGSIPSLDIFWYVNESVLYFWKWGSISNQQLEVKFQDPVTAVGVVEPKHLFSRGLNTTTDEGVSTSIPPTKFLLVATTCHLTLWSLRVSSDSNCILDATPTPYTCPCPNGLVCSIVGHDESGRLFFGDSNGGIYEFVFLPPESTNDSWMSFLSRLSPWGSHSRTIPTTIAEKVIAPSMLTRMLGRWIVGTKAIISLSVDSQRGLLYSVDESSNIQVFFLSPPEVTPRGVTEFPLQPVATLTQTSIISQMWGVYRQVLRVAHQQQSTLRNGTTAIIPSVKDKHAEMMIDHNKIIQVVPLGLHEGQKTIAVCLAADGSRLFLRGRLELPLLPKRLIHTNNPDILNYQYIKSIDIVNWKPPPPLLYSSDQFHSVKDEGESLLPPQLYYNNRTFLYSYRSKQHTQHLTSESSIHHLTTLAGVTLDEGVIFQRQRLTRDTEISNSRNNTLREWSQLFQLPNIDIFTIYEQPLSPAFHHLLDCHGPLPSPYDIMGRASYERFLYIKHTELESIQSDVTTQDTTTISQDVSCAVKRSRASFGRRCRTSLSPWDIPSTNDMISQQDLNFSLLSIPTGMNRTQACQKFIPSSSLHSMIATQTVPARVFIILTSQGVFQLQQQRLYDLLKVAATEFVNITSTDTEQSGMLDEGLSQSQGIHYQDIEQYVCTPFSQNELSLIHTVLSSDQCLTQLSSTLHQVPNIKPKISILNFYGSSYLFTPEQIMSTAWQILTFTWGHVSWPKMGQQQPLTTFSQHDPTATYYHTTSGSDIPIHSESRTPFSSSRPQSSIQTSHYLKNIIHNQSQNITTQRKFPLGTLIDVLVTGLTSRRLHMDSTFQDSVFLDHMNPIHGFGPPIINPTLHTFLGQSNIVSARIKGLTLYVSRIIRPFWSCPIFDAVAVNGNLSDLLGSYPAIYRTPLQQLSKEKKDLKLVISSSIDQTLSDHNAPTRNRKRARLATETSVDPWNIETSTSKRSSECLQDHSTLSVTLPDSVSLSQHAVVLSSRFNFEEFEKARHWLQQLRHVIHEVMNRLEIDAKDMRSLSTSLNKKEKVGLVNTTPLGQVSKITTDWELKFEEELRLLKSVELFCSIASQFLSCCVMLLDVKEGRELPAEIFDLLADASLSDMMLSSSHRDAFQRLLTRQILLPSALMERCSWIFGRDDLELQIALQPLKSLHRAVCNNRWGSYLYADCTPLEQSSVFRSNEVQNGIRKLLTCAREPNRSVRLEIGPLSALFAELQMFDVLADFICRLAESVIVEKYEREISLGMNFVYGGDKPNKIRDNYPSNTNDSYLSDKIFRKCLDQYYVIIEDLLDYYFVVSNKTNGTAGKEVAQQFVTACLSIPVEADTFPSKHNNNGQMKKSHYADPQMLSRQWLHYVVLDWINEIGKRLFPISLEDARSPVYANWVGYRKSDLGAESCDVLSKFFLSNKQYQEFAEFLITVASKTWLNPTDVLAEPSALPNFSERLAKKSNFSLVTSTSQIGLERHASAAMISRISSTDDQINKEWGLQAMENSWNSIVDYLRITQAGLSLEERYAYLIQARDGLACGTLQQQQTHLDSKNNTNLFSKPSEQLINNTQELTESCCLIDTMMEMVELQIALCRETIEIAIFLCAKYNENDLMKTFSTDFITRKNATEELLRCFPSKYNHLHNIQSLLYMLQWRIYNSPAQILRLIQEFAEASKLLIPFPGLSLILEPTIASHMPDMDDHSGAISRQSIVASSLFCRAFISVELHDPSLLDDYVSKFTLMIFSSRASDVAEARKDYHSKDVKNLVVGSQHNLNKGTMNPIILLQFMSEILITLHDAAVEFRDTSDVVKPFPSTSNEPFDWEIHWWSWPSIVIKKQLSCVDNFVSWDLERQLEGQQKLPVFQSIVNVYQKMLESLQGYDIPHAERRHHPSLKEYHYYMILLDIQESWLSQLLSMSSSLAYIHLLGTDSIKTQWSDDNSRLSKDSVNSIQTKLAMHLADIFHKSPSKMQCLSERCSDLMKACEAVCRQHKDWYTNNEEWIGRIIENGQFALDGGTVSESTKFCLRELRFVEKAFLEALEKVQRRISTISQYQQVLQQVVTQNSSMSKPARHSSPFPRRYEVQSDFYNNNTSSFQFPRNVNNRLSGFGA